ncbi:MAG: ATP-binding cassette domain-containing protein [Pseudoramibacter sp.]
MNPILKVRHLVKNYGPVRAVRDLSFDVTRGSLFAFLGTNGAGKSTTINILSTLMRPDSGDVQIDGLTLGKADGAIRGRIGVVFQNSVLDALLTVRENLDIRAAFYKLDKRERQRRIAHAAEATGCTGFLDQRYGRLSGGQKRRADIARALLQAPALLFLDEPTTGLDPKSRKQIWAAVADLQKKEGLTVFLTTHYMEEAAGADQVVIVHKGRIAAQGTPDALRERYSKDILRIYHPDPALPAYLKAQGLAFSERQDVAAIEIPSPEAAMGVLHHIEETGNTPVFEMKKGTMDDVFLNVVQSAEQEEAR